MSSATLIGNKRKTEPKEVPCCTIPLLLFAYTRQLEVLATALTERLGYERCGFEVRVRPWVAILFILIETLSITGQKFSKCLKMAATVYQRDSCIGASVFWSCSLKGHGRFETAVVGKLPILFLKIFFFLLFAETPLIETSFALYGDVPRIKCRNV